MAVSSILFPHPAKWQVLRETVKAFNNCHESDGISLLLLNFGPQSQQPHVQFFIPFLFSIPIPFLFLSCDRC